MKRAKYLLGALLCATSLVAEDQTDELLNQSEIRALRDWVNTKRQVTVKERGGNLSISGEVRTEYQTRYEIKDGIKQIGLGGAVPGKPSDQWDVEVNFMLDYRSDRSWAAAKIEYDNNAGTTSGTYNGLSLERAYLGGRIVSADTYTIDGEIGRRSMGDVFDSRIEFGSFMDGFVLKYDQGLDFLGDVYFHAGPFLVNERYNHYGYVGEIGILNLCGTGLFTKYSLIDWDTKDYADEALKRYWQFLNSQLILGYKFNMPWLDKTVTLYSAGLINSAAKRYETLQYKKQNYGYYIGFSIGQIRKKGDWSIDANYQVVAAQGVPQSDLSGIGTNNAEDQGLHTIQKNPEGGTIRNRTDNSLANARGQTNYRGFAVQFLYLISNNVTLYQSWGQSWTLNKYVGPQVDFRQFEIEVIYAF